ncbi:MAG: CPBP family intramembrane metalloprotease, partial [Anaerolineales bacterium]|nr:CPBP family intramembrane metalloprotease [Anaerolineales bacterium]
MNKLFGERLRLDWKIAVLTVVSTLALMMDYYHYPLLPWTKLFPAWDATGLSMKILDRTLLYFLLPMLIVLVVFRENPKAYGFTLGDWKAGLVLTLGAAALIAPLLWLVGRGDPAMQEYYEWQVPGLPWNTLLDLFGWEFFFRGWLLFGYGRKFGAEALWLQAVPFALAHLGKPEVETLSTIFGGFAFGWVAWRTRSFVYPLLIHWFVA